jgi:endo-alpha-1,4-polygalactosaminidase (GH114 family)
MEWEEILETFHKRKDLGFQGVYLNRKETFIDVNFRSKSPEPGLLLVNVRRIYDTKKCQKATNRTMVVV